MDIEFSSNRLAEASISLAEAGHLMGIPTGRKYIQRLAILRSTDKFGHLFGFQSLGLHPLKGGKSGQYSMNLTGNYRLIIEKIKEDKVRIINVEDYHGN